jgi:hypothetical protein
MVGMSYIYNNIIIFADKVFYLVNIWYTKSKKGILFTVALLLTM